MGKLPNPQKTERQQPDENIPGVFVNQRSGENHQVIGV
jgi:hypothetical protein